MSHEGWKDVKWFILFAPEITFHSTLFGRIIPHCSSRKLVAKLQNTRQFLPICFEHVATALFQMTGYYFPHSRDEPQSFAQPDQKSPGRISASSDQSCVYNNRIHSPNSSKLLSLMESRSYSSFCNLQVYRSCFQFILVLLSPSTELGFSDFYAEACSSRAHMDTFQLSRSTFASVEALL